MQLTGPGGRPAGEHPAPEMLERYREGDLGDAEARAVEEHVASCAECTTEMEQAAQMLLMLSALPQYPAPRSFTVDDLSARRQAPRRSRSLWPAYASLAASILLALGFLGSLAGGFGGGGEAQYASTARNVVEHAPNAGGRAEHGGAGSEAAAASSETDTSAAADTLFATEAPAQSAAGAAAAATSAPDLAIASVAETRVAVTEESAGTAAASVAGDTPATALTTSARSVAGTSSPSKALPPQRGSETAVAGAGGGADVTTRVPRSRTVQAVARRESSATQAPARDEAQRAAPAAGSSVLVATVAAAAEELSTATPETMGFPEHAAPMPTANGLALTAADEFPPEAAPEESRLLTGALGVLSLASLALAVALFLRARMLG